MIDVYVCEVCGHTGLRRHVHATEEMNTCKCKRDLVENKILISDWTRLLDENDALKKQLEQAQKVIDNRNDIIVEYVDTHTDMMAVMLENHKLKDELKELKWKLAGLDK